MDTDELQSDILDALDEDSPENVTGVVMEALLAALGDHLPTDEVQALTKKALAAAARRLAGEAEDDAELEDVEDSE